MRIYDPISNTLNLQPLNETNYITVYVDSLEKTSTKTHNAPNKGIKFNDEWRANIGKSQKGRISPMRGKTLPDNHPFKTGIGKNRVWTEEQKDKVRKKLSGRKLSEETKRKLSETKRQKQNLLTT